MERDNQELEINLLELFHYLKRKLWVIAVFFFAFTAVGFVAGRFLIVRQYTASTRMYVLNRSDETSVVTSDFQIASYMLNDYKVLITGRNVTQEVIDTLKLDMNNEQLAKMIAVSAPDNTRIVQVDVTDTDPRRAADIANTVREVASEQIKAIMDADAVHLVYAAAVPETPSAPDVMKITVFAAALGLVLTVGILTGLFILDDTIRTEEDVETYLGTGTLGVIPVSQELEAFSHRTKRSGRKEAAKWTGFWSVNISRRSSRL